MDTPTTATEGTQGNNGKTSDKFELPGETPVFEFAGKLVAIHKREFKGKTYVALSEVVPARMNGREVAAWNTVFGGLRLSWDGKIRAATQLDAARRAAEAVV